MNQNEKGIFCRDALNNLERGLTMKINFKGEINHENNNTK